MRPIVVSGGTTKNPEVVWNTRPTDTPIPKGCGHTAQVDTGRYIDTLCFRAVVLNFPMV